MRNLESLEIINSPYHFSLVESVVHGYIGCCDDNDQEHKVAERVGQAAQDPKSLLVATVEQRLLHGSCLLVQMALGRMGI